MKYFLVLICLVGVFSSFLPNRPAPAKLALPSPSNLKDFVIGYLIALKVTEVVPDGFPCVSSLQNLQNATETAWALIKTRDLENVLEAIRLVVESVNDTKQVCGACVAEGREGFQAFLNEVKDPNFIKLALERLGENFDTVLNDLERGVGDLRNGSYFNAGFDFGSVLHLVLSGNASFVNFIIDELENLGAVNWPFQNCAAGAPIQPSVLNLDSQPAKGSPEGVNVQGTVNAAVSLKQVQIVTLLNGTPLNTQYDPFAQSFQQGDAFNYRFSISIPGFAPSVFFFNFLFK